VDLQEFSGAVRRPLPARILVQLATLTSQAPEGDQWLHEMKFDGYRMICRMERGRARFISRNQHDWTERFPFLAGTAGRLAVKQALLDGEIVAVRPDGTTDFQALQNAFRANRQELLHYYVFDLLYLDGYDLSAAPLQERKRVLAEVVHGDRALANIHLSEHVAGSGPAFLAQACKAGLEGIICKRRDRPYRPGRSDDWLKVKCVRTDEFVIGGYSEPAGARTGFGALLVGYHDAAGALTYAGKVGTGFDDETLRCLGAQLEPLQRPTSPFADLKRSSRKVHWVEPALVAQVAYGSWTNDGRVRHASFQGLREDKPAAEVRRPEATHGAGRATGQE
jgi:bifunctional non-homologous end joining protein LigD